MSSVLLASGLEFVGGAPTPGAVPHWDSRGTVFSSATMPGTRNIDVPAHAAGDILKLAVLLKNQNAGNRGVLASINTAGWTQDGGVGNTYGGDQANTFAGGWKVGDGVETVVNITTTGGVTTDSIKAFVDVWKADDGFAASPVGPVTSTDSFASGPVSGANMPTVTPDGNNQLAVCYMDIDSAPRSVADAVGETGGSWTNVVGGLQDEGSSHTAAIQVSEQLTGAEISGGAADFDGSTSVRYVTMGFALKPALI